MTTQTSNDICAGILKAAFWIFVILFGGSVLLKVVFG